MNTSKNYYVERDRAAEAIYPAAEFAHNQYELYMDEQSQRLMDCYYGVYIDGETLFCVCPICKPLPEQGCNCGLCQMRRSS